ncbi:regulator of G protein signaling superfamily [Jaminaea rosea]|uniref:Regulator of G protein signaling superfamily n=1 Tax=Jaminaea rosea TaxID=1569628 RepID=A0A316V302_9BASI|nr:regulator of G protein signaling superfamily [Jaminaea rosea]PWN29815.1 regulator of G protein signaling superfamily [Jaminaea rosea]
MAEDATQSSRSSGRDGGQGGSSTRTKQQTSSRMMKTTRRGRPYAKDTHDLFATLIVSLELTTHRQYFKTYTNSFTTDEAAENLSALKFSQSNRAPDPREPSRVVTTTTTTTFSMNRDMAKGICQHFMDARLIENAADPSSAIFKDKGVYQLTPKGLHILERFITKNGINGEHLLKVFSSQPICMKLLHLERRAHDDELLINRPIIEVLFRRFCGRQPNYIDAAMAPQKPGQPPVVFDRTLGIGLSDLYDKPRTSKNAEAVKHTFSAVAALDWLCDFTTICGRDEAAEICAHFQRMGFVGLVRDSSSRRGGGSEGDDDAVLVRGEDGIGRVSEGEFRCHYKAIYALTDRGRAVARWPGYAQPADSYGNAGSGRPSRDSSDVAGSGTSAGAPGAGGPAVRGSFDYGGASSHDARRAAAAAAVAGAGAGGKDALHSASGGDEQQEVMASNGNRPEYGGSQGGDNSRSASISSRSIGSDSNSSRQGSNLFRKQSAAEKLRNDYLVRSGGGGNTGGTSGGGSSKDSHGHDSASGSVGGYNSRDSNTNRLRQILEEPALRSLYRDFLKQNFCEENLSFWLDVQDFKRRFHTTSSAVAVKSSNANQQGERTSRRTGLFNRNAAKQAAAAAAAEAQQRASGQGTNTAMEKHQQDLIAMAFVIYNTYLAPASPCELNIEHNLRTELVNYMTKVLTDARATSGAEGGGVTTVRAQDLVAQQQQSVNDAFPSNLSGPPAASTSSFGTGRGRPSTDLGDGSSGPGSTTPLGPNASVEERKKTVFASMPRAPLHASQLQTIVRLYERIQDHTFKLMATDSVPRFIKDNRFLNLVRSVEEYTEALESGRLDPNSNEGAGPAISRSVVEAMELGGGGAQNGAGGGGAVGGGGGMLPR